MATRSSNMDDDFFGTPLSSALNMPFNLVVGDIVLGRVSHIDNEYVYVSTGFKSEGKIPRSEFVKNPEDEIPFNVDDEVEVMVDRIGAESIFLSYEKVVEQRRWDELEKLVETQDTATATVLKAVKGGFRLDIGLSRHAFLPASHSGDLQAEGVEGREIKVQVLEMSKETGNIVVSMKELMKKQLAEREVEVFDTVQVGAIVEGKVTRLTNFGAFCDIGGVEGLIHISEIAWTRVAHPSALLACGDVVQVKILDSDPDKKKISLSLKQAAGDPWDTIEEKYRPDDVVDGVITKTVNYGAFVKLGDYFEGLLHNTEIQAAGDQQKKIVPGEAIKVRIINIDVKARRLKLGLPAAADATSQEDMDRYIDDGKNKATLGDMLGGALGEGEKAD